MRILKHIITFLLLNIIGGCSSNTQVGGDDTNKNKPEYELCEYLYLEYEEGAICHIDPNCGKHCTYIKTDYVISSVREAKRKDNYFRGSNGVTGAMYGQYHFCSRCIPLHIMKEIDAKTDPGL